MFAPKLLHGKFFCSSFLFLFFISVLFFSCRKIDRLNVNNPSFENPATHFFTNHIPKDSLVISVLNFVKRENEKYRFVNNLIKKIGYPYWDKTIVIRGVNNSNGRSTSDSANIFFIPFVLDSANTVNNILVVKTNPSDTNFHFIADWQYQNYIYGQPAADTTAENVALLFMMLDRNVFGHEKFVITDSNLFCTTPWQPDIDDKEIRIITLNNGTDSQERNGSSYNTVTVCNNTYHCGSLQFCTDRGGCDYLNCPSGVCFLYTICFAYLIEIDPGVSSALGAWGGGGGSGNVNWTPPNCPDNQSLDDPPECQPGWNPPTIIISTPGLSSSDSLIAENLKKLVIKMQNKLDSLYNKAQEDNRERCFTLEKNNVDTVMSWIRIGNARSSSPLLTSSAFGFGHTHQQDPPITSADINQCFDGADIYKLYKNTCIDGYNLNLSFLITKDFYYAFVITDKTKFKNYIELTISNSKNIYVIQDKIDAVHVAAWDNCTGCSWQTGSERGTLAVTANNNENISGVRVFRTSKQNINFTLLTQ